MILKNLKFGQEMVNFYAYSLCEYNTDCRRFQSGGSPWQMKCFIGVRCVP